MSLFPLAKRLGRSRRVPIFPVGLVISLGLLLGAYGVALAHANLVRSIPAANAVLDSSPPELRLWFSETPEPRFSEVRLLDRAGQSVTALGPIRADPSDQLELVASLQPLPPGVYTVAWRATSAIDGHGTAGSFAFVVGRDQVPAEGLRPVVPVSAAGAASGPTAPGVAVRWLGYIAFALVVGGFAFFPLVVRPVLRPTVPANPPSSQLDSGASPPGGPRQDRTEGTSSLVALSTPTLILLSVGVGLAVVASFGGAVLQAAAGSAVGVVAALGTPLQVLLGGTRYGTLFWARLLGLALVGGLLVLGWRHLRRGGSPPDWWWWTGLVAGALTLLTISLGSHAAADTTPILTVAADWLHLLAASVWIGGLVALSITLPRARRAAKGASPTVIARSVGSFSRLGTICLATIGTTGLYRAIVEVGDLENVPDTAYGTALLVKLGLLLPLLALAAVNLLLIRRRLAIAAAAPEPEPAAQPWYQRLRRAVGGEVIFVSAVLLVTSVLTGLQPAREAFGTGLVLRGESAGVRAILVVSPGEAGPNSFDTYLRDSSGRPIVAAEKVSLIFSSAAMNMGETEAVASDGGGGHYLAQGSYLSMTGTWRVVLLVRLPGQDDVRMSFTLQPRAAVARPATLSGQTPSLTPGVPSARSDLTVRNPVPADAVSIARGEAIYATSCAVCHGVTGEGDGPLAASLRPPPANLRIHMAMGHTDAQLHDFVWNGIAGSAMPPYRDKLAEKEVWDVINYLYTFAMRAPASSPAAVASPNARSLGSPGAAGPSPRPTPTATPTVPSPSPQSQAEGPPRLDGTIAALGRVALVWNGSLWVSDEAGAFHVIASAPPRGYLLDPAWSPDGQHVVYAVLPPPPTPEVGKPAPLGTSDLWEADLRGQTRLLVSHQGDGVHFLEPVWEQDGLAIDYVRLEAHQEQDQVVGSAPQIERRVLSSGERQVTVQGGRSPDISPDGRALVYTGSDAAGTAAVWALDLTSGKSTRLSDGRFLAVLSPRFSPDGQTIAFAGAQQPLSMQAPGGSPSLGTVLDRVLAWLFPRALAHGVPYGIWLVDRDGSNLRPVGVLTFDTPIVRWQADGKHLMIYDEVGLHQVDVERALGTDILGLSFVNGFDWYPRR